MKKTAILFIPILVFLVAAFLIINPAGALAVNEAETVPNLDQGKITDLDFWKDKKSYLYVSFKGRDIPLPSIIAENESRMEALIPGFKADLSLVRLHCLDDFEAGIRSLFIQNSTSGTRLVWSWDKKVPFDVVSHQDSLTYGFDRIDNQGYREEHAHPDNPGPQFSRLFQESRLPEFNSLFPGMRQEYTGDLISIDVQNAEVEHVIRLITSVTDYNLILDEDVRGRVSLRLINVPWDQALDLILIQKNLGMVHRRDIIRITTAHKLEAEQEQARRAREAEAQARESMRKLEPLEQEFIQINYSTASEMLPQIREFLSERGRVSHDDRTNTLVVQDTPAHMREIRSLIQNLDRPEKQVLIEARIVHATDEFSRSLGLQWNFMFPEQNAFSPSGDLIGSVNFESMNFPPMDNTEFISIGGTFGRTRGNIFTLDAQLRLGEAQKISNTISAPRIVTLNNEAAEIEQGVQVPFTVLDEAGNPITEFIPAVLRLSVTPQITGDGNIIISLDVSDDSPAIVLGEASVETRKARTKLFVANGETIVLGGIKSITEDLTQNRVPGLGNVPVLGWLFKHEFIDDRKNELLIFIRPEIL